MNPLDRTRRRLHSAASFLVKLAAAALAIQFRLLFAADASVAVAFRPKSFLLIFPALRTPSATEHAVAVAVKAIAAFDRVVICTQNVLPAGERGYQRQQSGLRQMEIRQ